MSQSDSVRCVFDTWARDHHASGMEGRHRVSVSEAFAHIPDQPGGRYLEIGVGNGYGLRAMAEHQFRSGTCFGLDVSEEMVRQACEKNADLANVRVERADFLDCFQTTSSASGPRFFKENPSSHSWPREMGVDMVLWSVEDYEQGFKSAGLTNIRQAFFNPNSEANADAGLLGTLGTWGVKPE